MPKLIGLDKWIEQMDAMIVRLSTLDCEKCLPEFMDRMVVNKIISEWKYSEGGISVEYTIEGHTIVKELS